MRCFYSMCTGQRLYSNAPCCSTTLNMIDHIQASSEVMTSPLFSPLDIGPVHVPNRIAIAPMCQYSAHDGCASDWHLQHLPMLAMSGAGLVMVEMTDVERHGRITHGCLGLYTDENERALARALAAAKAV